MKDLFLLLPEFYLGVTLLGVLLAELSYHGERTRLIWVTTLIGLVGALFQVLLTYQAGPQRVLGDLLAIDGLSLFFKILFLLISIQAIWGAIYSKEIRASQQAEFCAFILGAALAMCLISSSENVLVTFLGFQLLQTLFYFLAAFGRESIFSVEAATKQWVLALISAGFLLFGILFLMIWTQSLHLHEMREALVLKPLSGFLGWIVFGFIFLSFACQIGAFPMHFWVPDVLSGSPTPAAAFLSVGSLAASFSFGLRFFLKIFSQPVPGGGWRVLGETQWPDFLSFVAGVTLLIGPLLAIRQISAKRLLACLMLSESGFLLVGTLVLDKSGMVAVLFHFLVQLFCVMGAFYILGFFKDEKGSDQLARLRGVLNSAVPECLALLLFLICLVGLPPFPGFISKFAILEVASQHQLHFLVLVAILSMALATLAFAKLASSLMGDVSGAHSGTLAMHPWRRAALFFLFMPLFVMGIFTDRIFLWAEQSLQLILW